MARFNIEETAGSLRSALRVSGIQKNFGGLRALDNVSIEVERGSITALIGPNGAGKTTFVNVVSGIVRPDAGSVRFADRDLKGMAPHDRARLGIVRTFQRVRVFPQLTVLENALAFTWARHYRRLGDAPRRAALQRLESFGLSRYADSPPGALSFADRRRLEIVRALIARPEILMLDEPAAGMNPEEAKGLIAQLAGLRREERLTLLLIEHNMNVVMGLSDRIHVLNFGRHIASGTPAEIRANKEVIAAYLGEAP